MRPVFHPRLINGPFEDPGLFIPFQFQNRAIVFDLGDLHALSPRELLKTTHVFVSHTHMDHFIGFDQLLRLMLGRPKTLHLFGPPGFQARVGGKLCGYTWNLVGKYNYPLKLRITEIFSGRLATLEYGCRDRFVPRSAPSVVAFEHILHAEPALRVSAVQLDHGIPCLGFALEERFHVNIRPEALRQLGLSPGPWLTEFKQALYSKLPRSTLIEADPARQGTGTTYPLGVLADRIAVISPGQKISYVTDVGYNEANAEKICRLAADSDQLFIEAAFLEKDREVARAKHHLTARQAGILAARARARQFSVFHFSPRYSGQAAKLYREAADAYAAEREKHRALGRTNTETGRDWK
jgi:ribonuclease Z